MSVVHDTFTIVREIAACREHVFAAWANPELKRRWFVDSDGPQWTERDYRLDFRVGGRETGRFILTEGPGAGEHANVTHYLDIVDGERIAFAYTMAIDGRIHSASLTTVTFEDKGGGTRLSYTEQGAFFGASDGAQMRRGGWVKLLEALDGVLEETKGQMGA